MLPHPQSAVFIWINTFNFCRPQRGVYFFCENAKIAMIKEANENIDTKLSYMVNKHHLLSEGACSIQ